MDLTKFERLKYSGEKKILNKLNCSPNFQQKKNYRKRQSITPAASCRIFHQICTKQGSKRKTFFLQFLFQE